MAKEKTRSEIGRSSRQKGKRAEREACDLLRPVFPNVRRSVQYNGRAKEGDADLTNTGPLSVEVKFRSREAVRAWFEQAVCTAGEDKIPVVLHRKPYEDFLATLRGSDLIALLLAANIGGEVDE